MNTALIITLFILGICMGLILGLIVGFAVSLHLPNVGLIITTPEERKFIETKKGKKFWAVEEPNEKDD